MEFEEGDIVLCTVDRIIGTVVFVKIEGYDKEGSIVVSEIAPGRIRNLRDYVVPKKKIVCKILRIYSNGNVDLSLRRVSQKEQKEVLEEHNQEQSYFRILKSLAGEKAEKIIEEISKTERIGDFFRNLDENKSKLEKIAGKEIASKIVEILSSQKQKKFSLKKELNISSKKPNGMLDIKEILSSVKDAEIKYLAAGKYSIKVEDSDIKKADIKLQKTIKTLEDLSKHKGIEIELKSK